VQLLTHGQFALGFEHVIAGRRRLPCPVETAAFQSKVVARQLAELAGYRRLAGQNI
jgi:hypothetical protein